MSENQPMITLIKNGVLPDAYYLPRNREWQAIATVECTGKRVWAAWMAGGVKEPDPRNYIVLACSDSGGKNWFDPVLYIDCPDENVRGRDPVLWRDPNGKLWLYYGFDKTYALAIERPEADLCDLSLSEPQIMFHSGMLLNKPIALGSGEWLCVLDPFDRERSYEYGCCYTSCDSGRSWQKRGELISDSKDKLFHETCVVEKENGALWALSRTEKGTGGGIEESFSFDGGKTWTRYRGELAKPFRGPGSKFYMKRLASGNLLFVNNDSPKERTRMTAYLSQDDGKTWKALLLDGRLGCAYPDIAQDDEGNLYVVFDSGRSTRNEIRLCRFREEDVLRGEFYTDRSLRLHAISKNEKFSDIVSVEKREDGAAVLTEKGERLILRGVWTQNGFVADDDLSEHFLTDPFEYLLRR